MEENIEKPDLVKMGIVKIGNPEGTVIDSPQKVAGAVGGGVKILIGIVVVAFIVIFYVTLGMFYFGGYSSTPFIPFVIFGLLVLLVIFKMRK